MVRYVAVLMLGSVALAQTSVTGAKPDAALDTAVDVAPPDPAAVLPPLPSLPHGRSTVIGGVIRDVDPVMDEMTVKVFGGQPMRIFFDERTQVFRDGKKTDLASLHPNERASVETMLDGNDVFARSVHMLSQAPQGQTQGQVLSYDPTSGQLTVRDALSQTPITIWVRNSTSITRTGEANFSAENRGQSDLMPGALVSATFASQNGQGVASQISILATPGSTFTFVGTISFLNLSSQFLSVTDPRDGKSYKISFSIASMPETSNLHEGQRVMVQAHFNGSGYVASSITPN